MSGNLGRVNSRGIYLSKDPYESHVIWFILHCIARYTVSKIRDEPMTSCANRYSFYMQRVVERFDHRPNCRKIKRQQNIILFKQIKKTF